MHFSSDEPHLPRAQLPPVVSAFPIGQYSCKGGKPTPYREQSALAKFPNWSVFQWGAPHGSQGRGTPPSRVGSSGLLIPATSTKLAHSHPHWSTQRSRRTTHFPTEGPLLIPHWLPSPSLKVTSWLFQKCLPCPPASSELLENALSVSLIWHLAGATLSCFFTLTAPSWLSFVSYCFWIPTHLSGSWRSVKSC